jgi:fructokinase
VITAVGEALIDLVLAPDGSITATSGGAPFNVARACARLGAPVALVSAISTDRFGQQLLADLEDDGVDTGPVQRTEAPTTLAVADLDAAGAATYRFYLQGTSTAGLARAAAPAGTRQMVTGGLALAVEPMATAVEAMVLDAPGDVLVLVDLNCRPHAVADPQAYLDRLGRLLARADVVKASVEDLDYLAPGRTPLVAAADWVGGRTRAVLVTAGAADTTAITRAAARAVPVEAGPVVDTVGAGDSFTGGFLTWWAESGRPVEDLADLNAVAAAVRAGHRVAVVVVGRTGADPPRRGEVPPDWGPR